MKLLCVFCFCTVAHLATAQSPLEVKTSEPDGVHRYDDSGITNSSPLQADISKRSDDGSDIPEDLLTPEDSLGRTHNNNDGGHRISFADAIRLVGRRGKWVQTNLKSVQTAYNEGGVFGIAEYLATLPDVVGGSQVVEFTDVKLVMGSKTPAVTASLKDPLPLNGPPFVFDLSSVLPQVLNGVLDTKIVRTAHGERLRVVVAHNPSDVLLNVTSVNIPPTEAPPVEVPVTELPLTRTNV